MKFYRDGFNKLNLVIGSFSSPFEISFIAVNEPWDPNRAQFRVRVRRWAVTVNVTIP